MCSTACALRVCEEELQLVLHYSECSYLPNSHILGDEKHCIYDYDCVANVRDSRKEDAIYMI